jgi:hypothetical protein
LKLREYRENLEADAIAAARDMGQTVEDKYLESIGFKPPAAPRGRRKKERTNPTVQLSLLRVPDISVQISVDDFVQKPIEEVYGSEKQSEQMRASLLG